MVFPSSGLRKRSSCAARNMLPWRIAFRKPLKGRRPPEEEKTRSNRIKELTKEMHLLEAKESSFHNYRASCFDVILNRIDIRLAGVFKQALEFDDAEFFFKEFEKICKARLA